MEKKTTTIGKLNHLFDILYYTATHQDKAGNAKAPVVKQTRQKYRQRSNCLLTPCRKLPTTPKEKWRFEECALRSPLCLTVRQPTPLLGNGYTYTMGGDICSKSRFTYSFR